MMVRQALLARGQPEHPSPDPFSIAALSYCWGLSNFEGIIDPFATATCADSTMYELSASILNGVDHDAELRVKSCVERLRERVRDGVKEAFMFTLGARRGVRHTVTLSFERGDAILDGIIDSEDALGQVLSAYRGSIAGGLSCIDRLRSARQSLDRDMADELDAIYPGEASDELEQFLRKMDQRIERAGVVQRLFSLRSDFLGAYTPSARSGHITLHWGLIGLVAPRLGVSVEALALKVLAHEYAHALSHLGIDANGEYWKLEPFCQTDAYVHEGLANYMSAAALASSDDWWFREALEALNRMVELQDPQYREFQRWQRELGAKPEAVRAALRAARAFDWMTRAHFEGLLNEYANGR